MPGRFRSMLPSVHQPVASARPIRGIRGSGPPLLLLSNAEGPERRPRLPPIADPAVSATECQTPASVRGERPAERSAGAMLQDGDNRAARLAEHEAPDCPLLVAEG